MGDALSVIIPAWNEEENIEAVVRDTRRVLSEITDAFDIVVVDDASTDDTPAILAGLQSGIPELTVIRNPQNIGCHPSSLVGWKAARGEYMLFIPADGQIPASEFPKFLSCAKEGHDVVYSWRQQRADAFHRVWFSKLYNLVVKTTFGTAVHDTNSSSLLTRRAVETLLPDIQSDSPFITVEIILEAQRHGLSVGEVVIGHRPRTAGQETGWTAVDAWKTPVNLVKMLFWVWRQRLGLK